MPLLSKPYTLPVSVRSQVISSAGVEVEPVATNRIRLTFVFRSLMSSSVKSVFRLLDWQRMPIEGAAMTSQLTTTDKRPRAPFS